MGNGTSDGERRDDSFVERLGDRISAAPAPPSGPGARGVRAQPVLGPADFPEEHTDLAGNEPSGLFDGMPQPPPSRPDDAFDEFEGSEMPGESTRIEESEILADQSTNMLDEGPRMPFLWVESGKDKNKEYVLQEGETGVGRGIDNDVILTDVSVSRKHLRVLRDGAQLVLRDLGSGNGTTVNGKRVHQIGLNEGDRIELGETVLVVRIPAAAGAGVPPPTPTNETALPMAQAPAPMIPAWPQSPAPPPISASSEVAVPRDGHTATVRLPRRTLVIAAAALAGLALVLGVGVGVAILAGPSTGGTATPLTPTGTPIAMPPPVTGTPVAMPPPVTGVPATAVAIAPPVTGVPATTIAIAPPVTGVPATTVAIAPPVTGVPATTVAVAPPVTAVPSPPPPSAVAAPPSAVTPPRPSSVAVTPAPADTGRSGRSGRGARTGREPSSSTSAGVASAQLRVTSAYNSGDFDGASAIARDAARHATGPEQHSLEALANAIDSFAGLYPRIHAAGDAMGPVASVVPIALRLDRQIVSGGHYAREIGPRYVRYLVAQARTQIGSAPQTACPRVREALEIDGSSADAQGLARQCETAAQRMLGEAQGRERSDAAGAQRTYQQVQTMVPRSSSAYTTAADRLSSLRRARPVDEDE